MNKINAEGIWELEIPKLKKMEKYKYRVEDSNGNVVMKCRSFTTLYPRFSKNGFAVIEA